MKIQLTPIPNCELTTTQALLSPEIEYDKWLEIGRQLCRISACTNWWLGDWGNYGVKAYGDRSAVAVQLAEELGMDSERIRQSMNVAAAVGTRVPSLQWSHHREVMGLGAKDQIKWLKRAEAGTDGVPWSVSKLREQMRKAMADYHDNEPNPQLFAWAKAADDVVRFIKRMENDKPIEQWPPDRRQAAKEHLKEIHAIYERL